MNAPLTNMRFFAYLIHLNVHLYDIFTFVCKYPCVIKGECRAISKRLKYGRCGIAVYGNKSRLDIMSISVIRKRIRSICVVCQILLQWIRVTAK